MTYVIMIPLHKQLYELCFFLSLFFWEFAGAKTNWGDLNEVHSFSQDVSNLTLFGNLANQRKDVQTRLQGGPYQIYQL